MYDLDESESTETLDAPLQGVNFNVPFGQIASIALPEPAQRGAQRASVTLHSGQRMELECSGDLGEGNAGVLVFGDGFRSSLPMCHGATWSASRSSRGVSTRRSSRAGSHRQVSPVLVNNPAKRASTHSFGQS